MKKLAINNGKPVRTIKFPEDPYRFHEQTAEQVKELIITGKTHYGCNKYVYEFEKEFIKATGAEYAFATNSGTSALHLALAGLNIRPGDEVIVPAYTFVAVPQAVLAQGGIPVFVDIDDTFNISAKAIKRAITKKTKVIIVVHMLGNVARIDEILKIASEKNIKIIEDCAQAIGAEYKNKQVGSIGDVGCFSFNVKKSVPTGEGGMIITSDQNIAKRIALARGTGIDKAANDVISIGYTMFMTEMQAVLGLAAFKELSELNKIRRKYAKLLIRELSKLEYINFPTYLEEATPSFSRLAFTLKEEKLGIVRDQFIRAVNAEGIPFRTFYPKVLYSYSLFKEKIGFGGTKFPFNLSILDYRKINCENAERFCKQQVAMEFSPYITRKDVKDIISTVKKVVRYYAGKKDFLECPLCNKRLKEFLPGGLNTPILTNYRVIGAGYRLNKLCPNCGSKDRERLVYLYIKNKTEILRSKKRKKILHIAPEKNLQKVLKTNKGITYYSIDLNSSLADKRMNVTDLKFTDNTFDIILCMHVLEHVYDDKKAMSEIYRVLKPGGLAILQVPISDSLKETYEDKSITTPEEREKAFGQNDHVRIYGQDYVNRLQKAGFIVRVYDYSKDLSDDKIRKYALLKNEKIYLCSKKR